jgi:hypothetical protein
MFALLRLRSARFGGLALKLRFVEKEVVLDKDSIGYAEKSFQCGGGSTFIFMGVCRPEEKPIVTSL